LSVNDLPRFPENQVPKQPENRVPNSVQFCTNVAVAQKPTVVKPVADQIIPMS